MILCINGMTRWGDDKELREDAMRRGIRSSGACIIDKDHVCKGVGIYCSKLLLAIEVDGESHNDKRAYDEHRTEVIQDLWVLVIRYTNYEVLNRIMFVHDDLMKFIEQRKNKLKAFREKDDLDWNN